ncbi:protein of unknown function [Azospirillum lipoferum 4B]|uniref:Uncharacterized protein n=1 Tax=Azospirillum lipoferum (strain 4B) TaxID=862719 RepID=G7Z886_AZOL4|nr:protein of unknown function [Azospirillum lipoferum 4B]
MSGGVGFDCPHPNPPPLSAGRRPVRSRERGLPPHCKSTLSRKAGEGGTREAGGRGHREEPSHP